MSGAPTPSNDERAIARLTTGVPGLDTVLEGGLSEASFNVIGGGPGSGKTTLAQHIVFANATPERPGLYFTVLGEPTLKMIRYQQQFGFFDSRRLGRDVHLLNLSAEAASGDLEDVLARIVSEVERLTPSIVVVDSFRTLGPQLGNVDPVARTNLERFVQRLALHLTSWEATTFLISEYENDELRHPVFTVADGVFWLSQVRDRNAIVRKLQVLKVRGQGFMSGLHTMRITDAGLQVFPRIPEQQHKRRAAEPRRLSTGVPGLDELMGGGIPAGDAVLLAGPTGTGKSVLASQFVHEGGRHGEPAVIAVFEQYPERYLARAKSLGADLNAMIDAGTLRVIYMTPLDLSVDEALAEILTAVEDTGAKRVVIDSLTGFEVALAPMFREDARESLYRLISALTAIGVTVLMVTEVASYPSADRMSFTGEQVSFLTDDIIVQQYAEMEGRLHTILAVMKMRASTHSHEFHQYSVTPRGATVGESLRAYDHILTGFPARRKPRGPHQHPGLTETEAAVFEALVRRRDASLTILELDTGMPRSVLSRALERLLALDYAQAHGEGKDDTLYRAIAQVSRV